MVFKQGVSWGEQIMGDTDRGRLLLGSSHVPPSLGKLIKSCGDLRQGKRDPFAERIKPRHQNSDGRILSPSYAGFNFKFLDCVKSEPSTLPSPYMRGFLRGGGYSHTGKPGQIRPGMNTSQPPTSLQHLYQGTFDVEEGT